MNTEYNVNLEDSDFNFSDCSVEQEKPVQNDVRSQLKSTFLRGYSKSEVNQLLKDLQTQQEQIQVNLQRQVKELLVERSGLNSECTVLRDQLSETANNAVAIQQTQERLTAIEGENATLGEQLKKSQEQCALLEEYAQDMENKYNEIKDRPVSNEEAEKLATLMEHFQELQGCCTELEQRLEQKQLENSDMQKSLEEYEKQSSEHEEIKNQLAAQMDENKKLRALIDQHNTGFEKVKLQFIELKRKLKDQEKQLSVLESDNELAQKTKLELDELQAKYDRLYSEYEKVQQIASNLNTRNDNYEAALAQYRQMKQQYKLLTQKVEEQKDQIATLEGNKELMAEAQGVLRTAQEKYSLLHNQYAQARMSLSELNTQKSDLEGALAKYQQQEQRYIALERENESCRQEILSMGTAVQDILDQMDKQTEAFKKILEQLEVSQKQMNSEVKQKASPDVNNIDFADQISELNDRLHRAEKGKVQSTASLEENEANIQSRFFSAIDDFQDNESDDDSFLKNQKKTGRLTTEPVFSMLAK